jgi:carboxymethylenebutenolidase
MCYDLDARPPLPPVSGGAGMGGATDLVLTSEDGTEFSAHAATAAGDGGPGMVILPDVRGLHRFYAELAERFAEAGVHAVAIDYFGRTAGLGPRGDDFDYQPHTSRTKPETVAMDVRAAVEHVRSGAGGGAERVYTVGFCFGGRKSFNQAAAGHGLSGVVGFYGWPIRRGDDDRDAPADLAPSYACPVLGLFGGADRGIRPEMAEAFREALDEANVPNEIVIYHGAPHSFFDRTCDEHRDACDDAWTRMLDFVRG